MADTPSPIESRLAAEHKALAFSLQSLLRRKPVVCTQDESLRSAVARMRAEKVGSIVVIDARSRPVGIFTERDLLAAAFGPHTDGPVGAAMTRDPLSMPGNTPAYEAALVMIEHRIRHVLVTDGEQQLLGVVSERDLFSLQRLGLGELTLEIRSAREIDILAVLAARVRRLTRLLVEQGVAAEQLTLYVSLLNDRICQRIIDLVRKQHRWDRIGWCWLAFGSEGRFEQTFATDQDNGLLFEPHAGASAAQVRSQLLPFAHDVNVALDVCGYPLCKGNVMASNPDLCLSVAEWKSRLEGWISNSDPKALLDASICFDFRALAGDSRLADQLRVWFLEATRVKPNFLRLMAENALLARAPLTRWGRLKTEDAPGAPNSINLKLYGVRPFVDSARIYALARGLPPTNTAQRLRAAAAAGAMPVAEAQAAEAAFYFIQQIRLRHQAALANLTDDNANRIDPAALNELDRRTLKDAFRITSDLQARLALDYNL
jgi:CBS domain-containing protein